MKYPDQHGVYFEPTTMLAAAALGTSAAGVYKADQQAEEAEEARNEARKRRQKAREQKQKKIEAQQKRERKSRRSDSDQRSIAARANAPGRGMLMSDSGKGSGTVGDTLG